ncbi:hypothetical protein HER10_EVM0006188 [Colletotrichum scovillei]|uniref:Siderophore biosynthesis n=1 Tax=Colletotrichum scovillei TaxID=1209932 RepID=A0A9P7RCE7_9PEZI|nr:uncharacterized protein HER10_EVM0006188 [Colletotrichum scovillei]KAF4785419.1 hypothetical protein HER10_EVM0006188 [Colletotrichum scovillei]KAG7054768.1 siderophore biosynthesis [Colletotrichum scovillei]KAG7074237.1 siderophore biosynthesis [Colletotrichum scovillei]KAG7081205.1 siderophore biosynthesis [Colletotrichum scovillei]
MSLRYITSLAIMATAVLAKTDLAGCVSSDSVVTPTQGGTPYATRVWYVPGTGEICAALDCGGGRAPPKTTVPGCPSYEGTETYSPSFLPLQTSAAPVVSTTVAPVTTTAAPETTASASDSASVATVTTSTDSAAVESETAASATDVVVTSSGFSNATMTTLTTSAGSVSGSQSARSTRAVGSAATTAATTNSPNAAVPTGASRELFGLVAGVAIGAALL